MQKSALDDLPLEAIMTRWPETVRVLLERRMLCVGCPIAGFHTLTDAALEHGLPLDQLKRDVASAAGLLREKP